VNELRDIIVSDTLTGIGKGEVAGYLCHAYCHEGFCEFTYNNNLYRLKAGECLIIRRGDMVDHVSESEDLQMDVVYVTPEFIEVSTPHSNYGMKGSMALFNNPVMSLTEEQQKVCALDFDYIKRRLALTTHNFHRDAMINAIQCMIIDFFDFHASLYGNEKITSQYAELMERFMALLERGDYRKNREINYFADFIREVGLPTTFTEMGITLDDDTIRAIADSTIITPGCCKQLTPDEIVEILNECK